MITLAVTDIIAAAPQGRGDLRAQLTQALQAARGGGHPAPAERSALWEFPSSLPCRGATLLVPSVPPCSLCPSRTRGSPRTDARWRLATALGAEPQVGLGAGAGAGTGVGEGAGAGAGTAAGSGAGSEPWDGSGFGSGSKSQSSEAGQGGAGRGTGENQDTPGKQYMNKGGAAAELWAPRCARVRAWERGLAVCGAQPYGPKCPENMSFSVILVIRIKICEFQIAPSE